LSPTFNGDVTTYSDIVPDNVSYVTVIPSANDPGATITVNNMPVVSGSSSDIIGLTTDINLINIVVTAPNGSVKNYTILVQIPLDAPPAGSIVYNFHNDGITLQSNPVDLTPGDPVRPIPPEDQIEVYYGGRLLRKTGIFVQDTTISYDNPITSFTTATVDTALDLPINTKIIGTAYIVMDTNQVWVYTGSREIDSISGYVYRGLNYHPPEFSINIDTQELTLNIPEALIPHEPVRIDIIKREFSVSSEWNDVDLMNANKTLSIMDSTSTQARFLQARPAELPNNYYYGTKQTLTDGSGVGLTIGGTPLEGL
jgi:hypothetical protein